MDKRSGRLRATMTTRAQVTPSPGLLDLLEFPAAVQPALRFAAEPAMEGSEFQAGVLSALAAEENLSLAGVRRWIVDFFSTYEEVVRGSASLAVEILSLDIHVPKVPGATAELKLVESGTSGRAFSVSILGSGGGGKQTISFSVEDGIEVNGCTRQSYFADSYWESVEIVAGPDEGRRFPRLVSIGEELTMSSTHSLEVDACDGDADVSTLWKRFDYRDGSVASAAPKLSIGATEAWNIAAGLRLESLGMDVGVEGDVTRKCSLEIEYSLPGGRLYECHRHPGNPLGWWPTRISGPGA